MGVRFIVDGEPMGKGRHRTTVRDGRVRTYTPRQTREYEDWVKLCYLRAAQGSRLNGAIEARITGIFSIPKSISLRNRKLMLGKKAYHTKKIDCDNLAKIVLDALNGVAYDDDKQVCRLQVEKIYGEPARVEIELEEVT